MKLQNFCKLKKEKKNHKSPRKMSASSPTLAATLELGEVWLIKLITLPLPSFPSMSPKGVYKSTYSCTFTSLVQSDLPLPKSSFRIAQTPSINHVGCHILITTYSKTLEKGKKH
jgi:hypothetical protein